MRTYFILHLAFSYERKNYTSPHSLSKKAYALKEQKTILCPLFDGLRLDKPKRSTNLGFNTMQPERGKL